MTWLSQILSNRVRGWAMHMLQYLKSPSVAVGLAALSPPNRHLVGWVEGSETHHQRRNPILRVARDRCRGAFAADVFAPALGDARRFAPAAAQIIELGAPDVAAAHDLNRGD